MIEIIPQNTIEKEGQNRGAQTGRGTTINAEIRTTDVVATIDETSVGMWNKGTNVAQTQAKHC